MRGLGPMFFVWDRERNEIETSRLREQKLISDRNGGEPNTRLPVE